MKNTKNKLSLDQFKAKLGETTEALDHISGGILGACHDETQSKTYTVSLGSGAEDEDF